MVQDRIKIGQCLNNAYIPFSLFIHYFGYLFSRYTCEIESASMELSSIVVSRDGQGISLLESILGSLHIRVDVESEPQRAWAKISKSKIDAVIVDSDVEGSKTFLQQINKDTGKNAVPLLIVSNKHSKKTREAGQASFLFEKPITVEQAVHILSSARNMILDRRLRYHRQDVDIPVVIVKGKRRINTRIANLSQGGVGVRGNFPKTLCGSVELTFVLPDITRPFSLEGTITWVDHQGNAGIQLMNVPKPTCRDLQLWLERHYFTK
jgi:hypothetical protein